MEQRDAGKPGLDSSRDPAARPPLYTRLFPGVIDHCSGGLEAYIQFVSYNTSSIFNII
jgi:hypothetical protein